MMNAFSAVLFVGSLVAVAYSCDECNIVETDTNYHYRYFPSRANVERIDFEVRASNDAHIALSSTSSDQQDMYEIVIGGWSNTQSAIRRCKQCTNLVLANTPDFLDSNELRGFWIIYDLATGTLNVGKAGLPYAFMSWTDSSPLDVKYLGCSTGWGSTGEFFFKSTDCSLDETGTTYHYRYFPVQAKVERIEFKARANNDVHIALSPTSSDQQDMYEIVIGGWSNTQSAIRRCKQCTNRVVANTPNFLDSGELHGFWITYNLATGTLNVGKEGLSYAFMSWTDSSPLDVKYLGYSTGWGSTGEFVFSNIQCDVVETDTTYNYRYFPSPANVERIDFKATASNDVHIALSPTNSDQSDMYEIVIGGWGNTQSVIRRCKQCTNLDVANTPYFLDSDELREFWITYDLREGRLEVGREGQVDSFMSWTDPSPLDVKYLGYSTGWGSTGEFIFCNIR